MTHLTRRSLLGLAGAVGVGGAVGMAGPALADPVGGSAADGLPTVFASPTPQTSSVDLLPGLFNWYDASAGPLSPVLPAAGSVSAGVSVAVEKTDTSTNPVTETCAGTDRLDTSDGATSAALSTPGEKAYFASDGQGLWMRTGGQVTLAAAMRGT